MPLTTIVCLPPLEQVEPFSQLGRVPAKKLRGHNVFFTGAAGADFFDGPLVPDSEAARSSTTEPGGLETQEIQVHILRNCTSVPFCTTVLASKVLTTLVQR